MINIGDTVLATLDNYFFAPDGKQYRAVFGKVKAISGDQETLGIKTNARSTNWYATIGNMTIAGCQIHYVVKTKDCDTGDVEDFHIIDGVTKKNWRPSYVYDAGVE